VKSAEILLKAHGGNPMFVDPIDAMNFKLDPGAGGAALFLRFDLVDKALGPRQPSGELMTLTMLRADAERLFEQLRAFLHPEPPASNLN
jgi:hypothetical protein